jgi:hypothetical protein
MKRYNAFGLTAFLILLACTSAQAQKAALPVDGVANLTATMVLKVAFQKKPQLPVEIFVLADKGKIRVMRASTTSQVCIVKIERADTANAVGWAVREKLCWER